MQYSIGVNNSAFHSDNDGIPYRYDSYGEALDGARYLLANAELFGYSTGQIWLLDLEAFKDDGEGNEFSAYTQTLYEVPEEWLEDY